MVQDRSCSAAAVDCSASGNQCTPSTRTLDDAQPQEAACLERLRLGSDCEGNAAGELGGLRGAESGGSGTAEIAAAASRTHTADAQLPQGAASFASCARMAAGQAAEECGTALAAASAGEDSQLPREGGISAGCARMAAGGGADSASISASWARRPAEEATATCCNMQAPNTRAPAGGAAGERAHQEAAITPRAAEEAAAECASQQVVSSPAPAPRRFIGRRAAEAAAAAKGGGAADALVPARASAAPHRFVRQQVCFSTWRLFAIMLPCSVVLPCKLIVVVSL